MMLRQEHDLVNFVFNGTDALEYILEGIHDAVILDVLLPGMGTSDTVFDENLLLIKMPRRPVLIVAAVSKVSIPLPAASQPIRRTDFSSIK